MPRRDPVEAVGSEVHSAAARAEILLPGVEHALAVVLGVGAREYDAVTAQQVGALSVKLEVGGDVVGIAFLVQPIDQM